MLLCIQFKPFQMTRCGNNITIIIFPHGTHKYVLYVMLYVFILLPYQCNYLELFGIIEKKMIQSRAIQPSKCWKSNFMLKNSFEKWFSLRRKKHLIDKLGSPRFHPVLFIQLHVTPFFHQGLWRKEVNRRYSCATWLTTPSISFLRLSPQNAW